MSEFDQGTALGYQAGLSVAAGLFAKMCADPAWDGQVSMGFAATFDQELVEHAGMNDPDNLPGAMRDAIERVVNGNERPAMLIVGVDVAE